MGLHNNSGGGRFVSIVEGKFKLGEKSYSHITGNINRITVQEDEYRGETFDKVYVYMSDVDEKYIVTFRLNSGYGRGFAFAIGNADLTREVTLSPMKKEDKTHMFVLQGGKALTHVWTRDNPGNLPQLIQVHFGGKTLWDSSEQQAFLKNYLNNLIKPKTQSYEPQPEPPGGLADDLPF